MTEDRHSNKYKRDCALFLTFGLLGLVTIWSMFSVAGFTFEYPRVAEHGVLEPTLFFLELGIILSATAIILTSIASIAHIVVKNV